MAELDDRTDLAPEKHVLELAPQAETAASPLVSLKYQAPASSTLLNSGAQFAQGRGRGMTCHRNSIRAS